MCRLLLRILSCLAAGQRLSCSHLVFLTCILDVIRSLVYSGPCDEVRVHETPQHRGFSEWDSHGVCTAGAHEDNSTSEGDDPGGIRE